MFRRVVGSFALSCTITAAGLGGATLYYTRDVRRLHPITNGSLLHKSTQSKCYADEFVLPVDVTELSTIPTSTNLLTEYTRSFFCSPVFQLERKILEVSEVDVAPLTNEEIRTIEFRKPDVDNVAIFKLQERESNELIFNWRNDEVHGWTWMAIQPNFERGTVDFHFGSGLTGDTGIDLDTGNAFRDQVNHSIWSFMTLMHQMYSRVLLAAAVNEVKSQFS